MLYSIMHMHWLTVFYSVIFSLLSNTQTDYALQIFVLSSHKIIIKFSSYFSVLRNTNQTVRFDVGIFEFKQFSFFRCWLLLYGEANERDFDGETEVKKKRNHMPFSSAPSHKYVMS